MADSSRPDLVVVESPKAELERRLERLSVRALALAEEAFEVGPEPSELEEWPARKRKIYRDSQKSRSEMPGYLDFALRFNEAVNRRDQIREGARVGVNIENAVINLPAQLPPATEDEVKVIDAEVLRGEGE
jgi:hypothetical protein